MMSTKGASESNAPSMIPLDELDSQRGMQDENWDFICQLPSLPTHIHLKQNWIGKRRKVEKQKTKKPVLNLSLWLWNNALQVRLH